MRKRMSAFTTALLIWLTLYVIVYFFLIFGLLLVHNTVGVGWFALLCLVAILYALAIAGIVTHYHRGETASRLRWGPLCGIAGAAVTVAAVGVSAYLYHSPPSLWSFTYIFVLSTGIPSYIEYLKEGAPVATERVMQAALSGRLSSALARHVEDIEVSIDQVQKRVRRDLTLLTVALPIIFLGTVLIVSAIAIDLNVQRVLLATVYALFGVFFLIVAAVFSSLLKKPRFVVLSVNHSDAGLESNAATARRALVKDARGRLAIFLLVFAFPILALLNAGVAPSFIPGLVALSVLMLSALVCFLFGYWVLTRSSVAAIALDEPALHGLLGASVGVLPTKVRAGEAHSVLMDFNIAAASGGTISPAGGAPAFGADSPRPHYEVELQAAGATVDGEKRCAIFDVPATLKGIWSCSFPSAGTHALHLLLHAVRPARAQTGRDAFDREPIFTYMHNVRVDGRFTVSSDNAVSMIGIIVTAVSVLITLGTVAVR